MTETNVDHVIVYRDSAEQWRWRAVAGNGEIVSEGEAHTREGDAHRAAHGVFGEDMEVTTTPVDMTSVAEPGTEV
jgi:uncharacterized protein YegP (UPF0339 family)